MSLLSTYLLLAAGVGIGQIIQFLNSPTKFDLTMFIVGTAVIFVWPIFLLVSVINFVVEKLS